MADRVVLFENVAGLGRGYLQGISPGDILLAGGFKFATSQVTIDGGGNILAAGANVTISASASLVASANSITETATTVLALNGNSITLTGNTIVGTTTADLTLSSGDDLILTAVDSILLTGSPITALSYFTTTATGTQAAVRIGSVAGDPSLLNNGDLWYNSTLNKFRKHEGGVTSGFNASEAATFVVHPTAGVGDFTDIQSALDALPAEGGLIVVREGTYTLSTTLTFPNKPVAILGCGYGTIVNLTTAIAAFTFASNNKYVVENLLVQGSGIAGQVGTTNSGNTLELNMANVTTLSVEKPFVATGSGYTLKTSNCRFTVPNLVTAFHADGPLLWYAVNTHCDHSGTPRGGFTNEPELHWSDSEAWLNNGGATAFVYADNCKFMNGPIVLPVYASASIITGCLFDATGTVTRHLDIPAGADSCDITGNVFSLWTAEAIRNAANQCIVSSNVNCKVTETGSADNNRYNDIDSASTILGIDSTVEGVKRFDGTGSTTGSFVVLFSHTNIKGVVGVGTIKNTGGTNSLEVRETVTDAFGVTDDVITTVPFGDTYLLDPQANFDTARPPHVSYQVEIRHPGAITTYAVHHATEGAH